MSGGVYCPGLELLRLDFTNLELSEALNWNPLHCLLCQESLIEPIVLSCFHVFCRKCVVARRDQQQRIKCPLCGLDLDACDSNLTCDRIVKYFITSTNEKTDLCANCDQVHQPMFFCETCQQPLCHSCKEQTHQAKMFSSHRLVPHDERSGRATTKLCKFHEEPYILFSTDTKSLGCIMCFGKASAEIRTHFTDIDKAHRSGVDKLEKAAKQLKSFQKDIRDGILLYQSLLDEVRKSAQAESCQIQVLCQQMIDRLIEIRDQLLSSINTECMEREEHFQRQLNSLCAVVPTIQLNLLIASIFCSSANKLDFLDLAYPLIHRIQGVISDNQDTTPSYTAQIQTNYKAEFARALEPFLGMKSVLLPAITSCSLSRQLSSSTSTCPPDPVFVSTGAGAAVMPMSVSGINAGSGGELSPCGSVHSLQYSAGSSRTKRTSYSHFHRLKLMIDLAGAFGDEYNKIDGKLKQLQKRFNSVSLSAQEVQRDMTMRRCLVDEKRVLDVLGHCQQLKIDLGVHSSQVDDLQPIFQHIWEEQLDRVRIQQETYKNHITNVLTLREDLHRVITATEQLEPFVRSLTLVIQQIKPERCPTRSHADEPDPMQQIISQINTLEPNSQNRVDAIERREQQRKQEIEQRKNEGSNLLAAAKRQLKAAPKDHNQKRRSYLDASAQQDQDNGPHGADGPVVVSPPVVPTVIVKEVDRERTECLQLSPGSRGRAGATGGVSPKPHHKRGSNGELQAKLSASSASLDESFELLLTSMDCAPLAGNLKTKQPSAADLINSGGKVGEDQSPKEGNETSHSGKYGRSQTLSEGVPLGLPNCSDGQGTAGASCISHSLPTLSNIEPCEPKREPEEVEMAPKIVIPTPPRLPADLIAKVSPSTLEARERVLASLKEKVPRIDIGPSSGD